jgi:c-di-GMP-binding flagellar brake protein YcgR
MKKKTAYKGRERRKFVRLDYLAPLAYKVCKKSTISKILKGYTSNISQSGLLCNIRDRVKKNDIMWISFNRDMLGTCTDLETKSLIYQNGIIGKVIRTKHKRNGSYDVGIQFITREEKNLTHIYPKVYFLEKQQ